MSLRGLFGLSISFETIGIILQLKRAAGIGIDGLGKSMMHHKIQTSRRCNQWLDIVLWIITGNGGKRKTKFQVVKGVIILEAQTAINRPYPLNLQAPTNSKKSSVRATVGEIWRGRWEINGRRGNGLFTLKKRAGTYICNPTGAVMTYLICHPQIIGCRRIGRMWLELN